MQAVDNGEKSGKVKSLASLSVITNAYSSKAVSDRCWELLDQYLYDIDTFESKDIKKYGLQRFHVNGFWIGYIQSSKVSIASQILREHRRENFSEWKHVSVYVTEEMDLYVYSDYGRVLVPMIIVHYDKNGNPYTNLTKANCEHILQGKATIDWYLEEQIFEYISVEESHNCLVAETPEVFIRKNDPELRKTVETRYNFTHIFIPQSMLGIVALMSPFVNHTQSKRITMFTNQAKQSCGWSMYNFPFRMDKGLIVQ